MTWFALIIIVISGGVAWYVDVLWGIYTLLIGLLLFKGMELDVR